MIMAGFFLGAITFCGWAFAFSQMPTGVQKFFAQHNFLTDALVIMGTYYTLGGTIVALFAAAFLGVFFEIFTWAARNPTEFDWLFDGIDIVKDKLSEIREKIRTMNQEYKLSKATQLEVLTK